MKRLMHILFLSCLKATELIEKRFHFKLTFREKFQLKFHKMMCSACSNYEKQSNIIEKTIFSSAEREISDEDIHNLKLHIAKIIKDLG